MFYINGEGWRVFLVPATYSKLFRADGSLSIAACDEPTHTIYINQNLPIEKLWKVLCHEITHAAMFSYHISLTLDQEELLADLFATYGAEVIAITNRVFKKIQGEL